MRETDRGEKFLKWALRGGEKKKRPASTIWETCTVVCARKKKENIKETKDEQRLRKMSSFFGTCVFAPFFSQNPLEESDLLTDWVGNLLARPTGEPLDSSPWWPAGPTSPPRLV